MTASPASAVSPAAAIPWFEEVSQEAGIAFVHSSGHASRYFIPEIMSGGVGLLDFDQDGLVDIFCVDGGSLDPGAAHRPAHRLYRNLGHWRFEDVTSRAGLAGQSEFGMGCACADYDQDGWPDIYVTNLGRNRLYRNNGDGTFQDVTDRAGVGDPAWSVSAAFFDYDGDGRLDLVVANYLRWSREAELDCFSHGGLPDFCSPANYNAPALDTLYHNRGDGTFENVTLSAGLNKAYGNGLGVVCADFNRDGHPDIFIANDAMPNQLWINQGDGRFLNEALLRGCAANLLGIARAGMGVATVDLDENGWLDLFVTHLVGEGNGLFLNQKGLFTDTIAPRGPSEGSLPRTGFGVGFFDFDNDGQLDLYVANGRVKRGADTPDPAHPYAEPNSLLRGLGSLQYAPMRPEGGTHPPLLGASRGCAFGDLDNDGRVDIVLINNEGPVHVLRNRVPAAGHGILFRVLNAKGSDALGASVRMESGTRAQTRQVIPNQSYASSNDPRVHYGLGSSSQCDRVVVTWPGGQRESFGPYPAGGVYELRQGQGHSQPPD